MSANGTNPIIIASAARTAMGGFQGELSSLTAPQLGVEAIKAALGKTAIDPADISEVLMGCVLPAGQGQAPARQAALGAGLPQSVPCATVNKMCGSGMKTVMMAYDSLHARPGDIIVAGGMESMSNAPYLLPKARGGMRLGHSVALDHMFLDGLEDAYDKGRLMGTFAEDTATHYQFTRGDQDEFALASLERAKRANMDGSFAGEIAPVTVKLAKAQATIDKDEQPFSAKPRQGSAAQTGLPRRRHGHRSQFKFDFRRRSRARALPRKRSPAPEHSAAGAHRGHCQPRAGAGVVHHRPIHAIRKLLDAVGWRTVDVDLYEINEAFAVVAMAAMRDLELPHDIVNVNGGACALGHPIGASGARIIVTLVNALKHRGGRRGVAGICIGGGEATAVAVEMA